MGTERIRGREDHQSHGAPNVMGRLIVHADTIGTRAGPVPTDDVPSTVRAAGAAPAAGAVTVTMAGAVTVPAGSVGGNVAGERDAAADWADAPPAANVAPKTPRMNAAAPAPGQTQRSRRSGSSLAGILDRRAPRPVPGTIRFHRAGVFGVLVAPLQPVPILATTGSRRVAAGKGRSVRVHGHEAGLRSRTVGRAALHDGSSPPLGYRPRAMRPLGRPAGGGLKLGCAKELPAAGPGNVPRNSPVSGHESQNQWSSRRECW